MMKIRISYNHEGIIYFIEEVDYSTIEVAKIETELSLDFADKIVRQLGVFPLKRNLIYEYQELIDARNIALKAKVQHSLYRLLIVFLKNCPSFIMCKVPYQSRGLFADRFLFSYDEEIKVNLQKQKNYGRGSLIFHLKLK